MVIYEGIFFEGENVDIISSLEKEKLDKIVDNLHCTFKYKPDTEEIFNDIVGQTFEVYLVGYGCDRKNSGFSIVLPDVLKDYYINHDENTGELKVAHITTSLSNDGKAVDTKNLSFNLLDKPIKIIGRFGYFLDNKTVSYEPFILSKELN